MRRARHPDPRRERGAPEADAADRRQADGVAHHEGLRAPRRARVRPVPRLQGLAHQGVLPQLPGDDDRRDRHARAARRARVRRAARRGGLEGHARRDGRGDHDRRPRRRDPPLRRGGRALPASPTATACPTWTSAKTLAFHRAARQGRDRHRGAPARALRRDADRGRRASPSSTRSRRRRRASSTAASSSSTGSGSGTTSGTDRHDDPRARAAAPPRRRSGSSSPSRTPASGSRWTPPASTGC